MKPTEPDIPEESPVGPLGPTDSDASPTQLPQSEPVSCKPTPSHALSPEPPQLAYVPLNLRDEPVMAAIIPGPVIPGPVIQAPVVPETETALPWLAGERVRANGTFSWQNVGGVSQADPLDVAVAYTKALFSREAQEVLFDGRKLDKIYSVPRRFDLSTLFVVSTAFAMLFTLLGYIGFSSPAKLAWCFFFSGVGFAQAALYNGRAPRLASVIAGGCLLALLAPLSANMSLPGSICLAIGSLVPGLPGGYIAGTLIGGVFLVADKLRNRIAQQRAARLA